MESKITIAIDGYAACGKSTLAKALAKELKYAYVDSGAMYRAVTLYFLEHEVDSSSEQEVAHALKNIHIEFRNELGKNTTYLNGKHVEEAIREMRISQNVSPVSAISAVRRALVQRQQELGSAKGIAMDGRDIGTVVFRDAELKLFMTADIETRTRRRLEELQATGINNLSFEQVQANLLERDALDSNREDSPLRCAKDAVVLDNSKLSQEEQFVMALSLAKARIEKKTLARKKAAEFV